MNIIQFREQFPTLFWDVADLDQNTHKQFIVERTLEYGTGAAVLALFKLYKERDIIEAIKLSRSITKKTALFWQNRLNIQEPILCIQKQSIKMQKDHWNN